MAQQDPGFLPIPPGVASPLQLATYVGAPDGMSRAAPQHVIGDTEAWTLVDVTLNDPGFIRRRGPLTELSGSGKSTRRAVGMARTQDPAGVEQILVFASKSDTAASEFYGIQNTTGVTGTAWPYNFGHAPYELFDAKDAAGGGVMIGTAPKYDKPANQGLGLWRGGSKDDATNLAVSAVARGDTSITVTSAIASVSAGHHVFDHATGALIGVVKSISGSVATLEHPALAAAADHIDVKCIRGINPRVSVGRITTSKTSVTVNGGATKFSAQGLASGTWDLFTPDFTYIGTVASVESDASLTLSADAAVDLLNADYLAIRRDGSYSITAGTLGWLNASFGGHQFYAKGNVVYFSDLTDPEAVDTTADGNSLIFSADPVRALLPSLNALVVVTENEAFALTGAIGTTPDRWRGERIHDDGTICGMAGMSYQAGVIWAGERGVWFYDGANPVNIVEKMDGDWRLFTAGFSSASHRAYCALVKEHYVIFMEGGASGIFQVTKDATTTNITRPTFTIHLTSGSIAMWQNVEIRGFVKPPDALSLGTALLPITTLESTVPHVRVVTGETLFTDSGNDAYTCEGGPGAGPDFYVETKKYSMGDPQRLKLFRMVLLHYWAAGGNIRFDTVVGLNTAGVVVASEFWATTAYVDKRVKFNRRTEFLSLRFYQSPYSGNPANLVAASTTRITLGPWALGFKWKRPGRV